MRFWVVSNGLMASFFAMAAYVQHNDPDWAYWIPVYAWIGIICVVQTLFSTSTIHARHMRAVLLASLLVYSFIWIHCLLLYVYHHVYNEIGEHESDYNHTTTSTDLHEWDSNGLLDSEMGREMMGVLIVLGWLCVSLRMNFQLIRQQTELHKHRALHGMEQLNVQQAWRLGEKTLVLIISAGPLIVWAYHLARGLHLC